jgi:hypothetical protein
MSTLNWSQPDIAEWIASLLPSELWEHYSYLSYAQMAEVPELADYAEDLREAERDWERVRKQGHIEAALPHGSNRIAGNTRGHIQ